MLKITTILFLLMGSSVHAQYNWTWANGFHSGDDEEALDIAAESSTGVNYTVGYFEGDLSSQFTTSVNGTPSMSTPLGNRDAFVAKHDSSGAFIWAFKIGASGADVEAHSVTIGPSGGIFVAGFFNGNGVDFKGVSTSPSQTFSSNNGSEDAFVAKYNTSGELIWVLVGASNENARALDVVVKSNGIYCTGYYDEANIVFLDAFSATASLPSGADGEDIFVAAFNLNGSHKWLRRAGDNSNKDDRGIAIDVNGGNVFVGGVIGDDCIFDDPINGNQTLNTFSPNKETIFIANYNVSDGALNWLNRIGGTSDCLLGDLCADASSIYLTGGLNDDASAVNFPGIGPVNFSGSDEEIFVAKINHSSQITTWYNVESNNSGTNACGEGIMLDASNNVLITGRSAGTTTFDGGAASINALGEDVFVAQYDNNGAFQWVQDAFSFSSEHGVGIAGDNANSVYICGGYNGTTTFGAYSTTNNGGINAYAAKLNGSGCVIPPTVTCPSAQTVIADPSCNFTIPDYTSLVTVVDNCGSGYTIAQMPSIGSVVGLGDTAVKMIVTDNLGNVDSCSFNLDVVASVNPTVVSCGNQYIGESTIGDGNNGNGFSCIGFATAGEDTYYELTVPSGNFLIQMTLDNVVSANNAYAEVLWVGAGCPGSTCLEATWYDIGNQQLQNGTNTDIFEAPGPGTYYLVIDAENVGIDNFDIRFDCIQSGVAFDDNCPADTDNDGLIPTVDGNTSLNVAPCDQVTICHELFLKNPGLEWLDSVIMDLGPCYTNVTNISPSGAGSGMYDAAGTWIDGYSAGSNTITWDFTSSVNPAWGDGSGGNYTCLNYDSFCFDADIDPACPNDTSLEINITVFDDGTGNAFSTATSFDIANSNGFSLIDNPPIILGCPSNFNISANPGTCAVVPSWSVPTINDECPGASITQTSGPTLGSSMAVGAHTIVYTATDPGGNTANCSFVITVEDNELPTMTCPQNDTLVFNSSCQVVVPNYILGAGINDNCGVASSIQTPNAGTTISSNAPIVIVVTDVNGNIDSCNFLLVVADSTPPTVVCSNHNAYLDAAGNVTISASDIDAGSTDNCSSLTLGLSQNSFACSNIGANSINLTVTDASGNSATCSAIVTVLDTIKPSVVCPANQVLSNDPGACGAIVSGIDAVVADNCGTNITWSLSGASAGSGTNSVSGTSFNTGMTDVTYYVTDPSGNIDSCEFTVTVNDTELPTISCPADDTLNLDASCQVSVPNYLPGAITNDNCGVATTNQLPSAGSLISSNTPIVIIVTDINGNIDSCNFMVVVQDSLAPSIVCSNHNAYLDATGHVTISASDIDGGSVDNCSSIGLTLSQSSFTCSDLGSNNVTLTATDLSGNSASCVATVTVLDTIKPSIVCPTNQTVSNDLGVCTAAVNGIDGIGSDNCGTALTWLLTGASSGSGSNTVSGTTFNQGVTNVTYYVSDPSGNSDSCSFTVTVNDTEDPVITCPAAQTLILPGACSMALPDYTPMAVVTDNCPGVTWAQTPASGTMIPLGNTSVTMTATDAAGNMASCSFNVEVVDNILPNFTFCPDDITSCSQVVTWSNPLAADNCGVPTISQVSGPSSGSTFPIGITQIEYQAMDGSGNTASCQFIVEVLPQINPVFVLPDTVCLPNGAINLSSGVSLNPGETSQFYSDSSQVFINGGMNLVPNVTGSGTYPITHVVNNGYCSDSSTLFISLFGANSSSFSNPPAICASDLSYDMSQHFVGQTATGGTWTGGSFVGDIWDVSLLDGSYPISYIVGIGQCADTSTRTINVLEDVVPDWTMVDTVCMEDMDINLASLVTGTSGGQFSGPGVSSGVFSPSSLSAGSYNITYEVGVAPCSEQAVRTVVVMGLPFADAGPDQEICALTGTLQAQFTGGTGYWTWNSSSIGVTDAQDANSGILASSEGSYELIWEVSNGYCLSKDTVEIEFYSMPTIVDAGPDQELDFEFQSNLDGLNPDYGAGTWSTSSTGYIGDNLDPMSFVGELGLGDNLFFWSVENGVCPILVDTINIHVDSLEVPSGFSPNGDLDNEFFEIPGLENASHANLVVFNRWGKEVYKNDNYRNDWAGTQDGNPLPADTYFYILIVNQEIEFSGYLVIKR